MTGTVVCVNTLAFGENRIERIPEKKEKTSVSFLPYGHFNLKQNLDLIKYYIFF